MTRRHAVMLIPALLCVLGSAAAESPALRSGTFTPPRPAPDFTLQGSDGSALTLSRYRGSKVVALGFGYTSCPTVCPLTLATLAQVRKKLGAEGEAFQVVYVTVDPQRDDPKRLREYLAGFDATFLGATGTPRQLTQVSGAYGIQVQTEIAQGGPAAAYLVHHSSFVYLIDREGSLRALVPAGGSVDDLVHDVKVLLGHG